MRFRNQTVCFRNQTVRFLELDRADSEIRPCRFQNQTVRIPESDRAFPESDRAFPDSDSVFRNQTNIRPCVSESDRGPCVFGIRPCVSGESGSDRVFPETHRCDFFYTGVFLELDRADSEIRPCVFWN